MSKVWSSVVSALKNPKVVAALVLTAVVGALWVNIEQKQDQLRAARDSLQTTVQQNRALRDSLQRDTTFQEDGLIWDLYSRTDFVGAPDTSAPDPATDEDREATRSTTLTYEADSASTSGQRHTAPSDTMRYEFTTDLGRYGLQADLSVWPRTGRLDYRFRLDPPAVEINLYQTRKPETGVTETFVAAPSGTVRTLRSTRTPNERPGAEPTTPWSYGAAVAATPTRIAIGPRLDYSFEPGYVSLSAGYSPSQLRTSADPISMGIEVGVMF